MTIPTRESKRGLPTSLARYADCGLKRTTLDIDTLMDNIEMTVVMTAQMVNFLDHQRRSSAMKGYLKVERDIQKVLHNYEEEFAKEPRFLFGAPSQKNLIGTITDDRKIKMVLKEISTASTATKKSTPFRPGPCRNGHGEGQKIKLKYHREENCYDKYKRHYNKPNRRGRGGSSRGEMFKKDPPLPQYLEPLALLSKHNSSKHESSTFSSLECIQQPGDKKVPTGRKIKIFFANLGKINEGSLHSKHSQGVENTSNQSTLLTQNTKTHSLLKRGGSTSNKRSTRDVEETTKTLAFPLSCCFHCIGRHLSYKDQPSFCCTCKTL